MDAPARGLGAAAGRRRRRRLGDRSTATSGSSSSPTIPKAVEIALASDGVAYAALPPRDDADKPRGVTQLRIESPRADVRLTILTPQQRRNRPRRDDEPRLDGGSASPRCSTRRAASVQRRVLGEPRAAASAK